MAGIVDYKTFLQQARVEVLTLRALEARRDQMLVEQRQSKRSLENEKKAAEDDIRLTTKTRRDEVAAGYDKQLAETEEKLKEIRNSRGDARGKGVKARIDAETAQLRDENRELKKQIDILFRKYYVPPFCNNWFYYAIYCPKWAEEYLVLILSAAAGLLALPAIIYRLLPVKGLFWIILVYVVFDLLFIGLFGLVGGYIREDHITPLAAGRQLRDQLRGNNKQIRSISRKIRRDKDETAYDLGHYDDQIAQLEQKISELTAQKEEALNTFDTVTKNIIADEVTASHQEKLNELDGLCSRKAGEIAGLEASIEEKNRLLDESYAPHVGREFLTEERLDALLEIMEERHIASLGEALSEYRQTHA